MHSTYKKPIRGKYYSSTNNNSNRNSFRGSDNYSGERRKSLSDGTIYNIARFLMGNEVQILTRNEMIEGVLRGFDSLSLCLSKVAVYGQPSDNSFNRIKLLQECKEVSFNDVLMIKVLSLNGKADSVLIDQEISHRKQVGKSLPMEDKELIPYFGEDEPHVDDLKVDLSMSSSKGDDNCWYHPEDMIKDNESRLVFKSTFNDNMTEYTTQIDRNDPLLQEKIDRAARIAREIENENSSKRVRQLEDEEDEERDEESQFSAVVSSVHSLPPPVQSVAVTMKLNPNAPEFCPRPKEQPAHLDEMISVHSLIPDSTLQQQQQHQQQQQQQQQHQQQQQMMQRFSLQLPMTTHTVATQPQLQTLSAYPNQRLVNFASQWPVQAAPNALQYPLMYHPQHAQLIPPGYQAATVTTNPGRQMVPEAGQAASLLYSLGPFGGQFFVQQQAPPPPEHMSSSSVAADMYESQQLRQPHIMPTNIPLQTQQQQQLNSFYTQSPHQIMGQPMNAAGHPNFQHLVFNQQAAAAVGMQGGYVSNGRS